MSESSPTETGLTSAEAHARLLAVGSNELPREQRPSFFRRLTRQFKSALLYLLLAALGFDLLAWVHGGAQGVPIEALAIFVVLLLNAGLGVLQEYRSERALDELEKLGAPKVWTFRDGTLQRIETREVVPGDRIRLEAGDRVPADGTALRAESLALDESMLTGESLPVEKVEGSEVSSGTSVLRGRTDVIVTRTGSASTMGRLAGSLARIEAGKTPLERRIDRLGVQIARGVGVLSALLILGGLLTEGLDSLSSVVMFAVAFGVAVVPESMPAMMTLALAFGVQRMARKNAVVRRLAAVEALGSVTVIATDKTGTLTTNHITVESLHSDCEDEALLAIALANDAERHQPAGDPVDRGLVEFAEQRGADVEALRFARPRVSGRPFDSRWKYMRVTVMTANGERRSYVKGAVEIVLERSSLDEASRRHWLERSAAQARRGFKVLGLATGRDDAESDLTFLGFVTLWDAPRPEARRAVEVAEAAGIRVLMLTGDHPETARSIGEHVGIVSERALSGVDLDSMSQAELVQALSEVRLFSRMLPEHKLRIVEALQSRGEVVAMTGDGLNDAPALKQADIGVAMGQRGSEVTREVADVVLLDDHFLTIVSAVEEGRVIHENIMNFIRFTFSSNVALMLIILGSAAGSFFLGLRTPDGGLLLPLTALQILWINFLGDGPPALALSVDRSPGVMQRPPRPRHGALLDPVALRFILIDGTLKGAVGLLLLVLLPQFGVSLPATAAGVFLYEAVAKLASAYPARKAGAGTTTNLWLHCSIAAGLGLSVACVAFAPLRSTLGLASLESAALLPLLAAVLFTALTGELVARAVRVRPEGALVPRLETGARA